MYQAWIEANSSSPHVYAAWFNLGSLQARNGNPGAAATAYGNALTLNPAFHPAAINLGLTLEGMGEPEAALRSWSSAVQPDDARTMLLNHKGRLLERLGRLEDAERALRLSLLTNPAQPGSVQHFLHIRQKGCCWPVIVDDIPGLSATEQWLGCGPLAALALTDDVEVQRKIAARWIAATMPAAPGRLCAEGYRHDRVRLGYLSSDFCSHAMGFLIAEMLECHDRTQFEVYGYCSTLDDGSVIRERILAGLDHHRDIRSLSDEQAASLIREDEIDILIDLNGLTAHSRMAILRWRPAPIQATYLGFVGPIPLPELDYLFCDDFVIPPSHAAAYHPVPLRIGPLYQANDSKRAIAKPSSRQDASLPPGKFVLCCFSSHFKITEAMFSAWMSVLRQADNTVLWLAADTTWAQANMQERAVDAGIEPGRLIFMDRMAPELYLQRLALADLFLDTFPYNAGTIASDAIRMQVPLLTLCGASFASRMAGSLLNAIGAQAGITHSLDEYVHAATVLATDSSAYARYKQYFTTDAWNSAIGDTSQFTIGYEAVLKGLVKYVAREPEPSNAGTIAGMTLVDLINETERLVEAGTIDACLKLYAAWLMQHPDDPLWHVAAFNQGSLLSRNGDPAGAIIAFIEAIRCAPDFLPAYLNGGLAAERLGQIHDALGYWAHVADRVTPINGEQVGHRLVALRHISRVCKSTGNIEGAEEALRRCIDIEPHARDVIQHWVAVRQMQCKWPVVTPTGSLTQGAIVAAMSPLAAAIHMNDPIFQLANAWRSFGQDAPPPPRIATAGEWATPDPPMEKTRLRIGYVSPDLREHAVGFLTSELFGLHDRRKIEVFAYFSGGGHPDAVQDRIRGTVDHWCNVSGWPATQTARRMLDDEIDILVDLGGHTGESPSAALALRPAPVLVNWLGYPGSMGTPHHQYIIADATIIPPAYEKYYSERVLRLPCYQPTDRSRRVGPPVSRTESGLPQGAMVYCCFNGSQKISQAVFECWMTILARTPDSVLWLLSCDPATDARLKERAELIGIPGNRLIFAPRMGNAEHLARYSHADLFLDTWPYGAHTTASDALWMGLPVLTVAGRGFASRVCASLVTAAGLPELVCADFAAYVDQAVMLGLQEPHRNALRVRLRAGRDTCILFDMPNLVQHLEALYETIWQDVAGGRVPRPDLNHLDLYAGLRDEVDHDFADLLESGAYERRYQLALTYQGGSLQQHPRLQTMRQG